MSELPGCLWINVSTLLGLIISIVYCIIRVRRLEKKNESLRKEIERLD